MKGIIRLFCCVIAGALFCPALVFGGGNSQKAGTPAASTPASSAQQSSQAGGGAGETAIPMDVAAATVQYALSSPAVTILRGQLEAEIKRMEQSAGRALTVDEKKQVLDVMINERLAVQAAESEKISITDNELNQQLQELRSQLAQNIGRQPTEEEFSEAIRNESGLDLDTFRDQLRRQMLVQKYLMSKKQNLFNSITSPTEAEITSFYNLHKTEFIRPDTVRFSMIQIPVGTDAASRASANELADRLVKEIGGNPGRFDEAVARSASPSAGYQGGDGGYLPRNAQAQQAVGTDFFNTAFGLKQGEVSKKLESPRGFHIIKITETYEQKSLALDDIVQPGSRVTVRDYIGNGMLQERQAAVLEQAQQELVSELRTKDTRSGQNRVIINEKNLPW